MKSFFLITILLVLVGCDYSLKLETPTPPTGLGGGGTGPGGNLLFSDSFPVDGTLAAPWAVTLVGDPLPVVTGGKITSNATAASAHVSTVTTSNVYSEVEFQLTSAPAPAGTTFILPHRHSAGPNVVFCTFAIANNRFEIQFRAMLNGGSANSGNFATSITDSDLALHKGGCSAETVGADILMKAYIDPNTSATVPVATHTFVGAAAAAASGTSVMVIIGNNNLVLDNFAIYQSFPY